MTNPTTQACKFLTEENLNSAVAWLTGKPAKPQIAGQDENGKYILIIEFDDLSDAVAFHSACGSLTTEW